TGHPVVSALYRVRQDEKHKAMATVLTGAFLGVMVTMSSVGAGALGAVILLFLYPKMKGVEIVATDIAHAVPLTAIAGLGHSTVGTVDWSLLSFLVMGSLPGIYIGSHLGVKISDRIMRPLLAVLLLLVGIKCLV
ncbi:MAG TPA: sulfite exporter TauE/SafE family protein, partial [Methylophaga sp.]|nr:sulfite exporter TauE/SafE family protein [Methylophaga sp.]